MWHSPVPYISIQCVFGIIDGVSASSPLIVYQISHRGTRGILLLLKTQPHKWSNSDVNCIIKVILLSTPEQTKYETDEKFVVCIIQSSKYFGHPNSNPITHVGGVPYTPFSRMRPWMEVDRLNTSLLEVHRNSRFSSDWDVMKVLNKDSCGRCSARKSDKQFGVTSTHLITLNKLNQFPFKIITNTLKLARDQKETDL